MAGKPVKPIESYPDVEPEDRPPVPPSEPVGEVGAEPAAAPPEVARLDFVDAASRTMLLRRAFRLEGVTVTEITVRRLTVSDVALLVRDGNSGDLYAAYAAMTGLPAAVLRGLDADDGLELTGIAWDFLPQRIREIHQPASTST